MSEIVDKWRRLQKGPLVPRANQPSVPKPDGRAPPNQAEIASRYAPRMPQRRLEITSQAMARAFPKYVSKRPELLERFAKRGITYSVQSQRERIVPRSGVSMPQKQGGGGDPETWFLQQTGGNFSEAFYNVLSYSPIIFGMDEIFAKNTSYAGYVIPGKPEIHVKKPWDLWSTAHEAGHQFSFSQGMLSSQTGIDRAFRTQQQVASETFGADRALMGLAGLPSLPLPGYLTPLPGSRVGSDLRPITPSGAIAQEYRGIEEQIAEAFAASAVMGGGVGSVPPSLLPYLAKGWNIGR